MDNRSGKNHWNWKGGRTIDKDGYVLLLRPKHPNANHLGYVQEHRLKMEKKIGRYLTKEERVHHKDRNHANNKLRNLVLYPGNGAHLRDELTGRKNPEQSERMKKWLRERPEWRANRDNATLEACRSEAGREHMRQLGLSRKGKPVEPKERDRLRQMAKDLAERRKREDPEGLRLHMLHMNRLAVEKRRLASLQVSGHDDQACSQTMLHSPGAPDTNPPAPSGTDDQQAPGQLDQQEPTGPESRES